MSSNTYTVDLKDTRGRTTNKFNHFKRSKSESKNQNVKFCPYCNINFITEGKFRLHYETQIHKNNLIKCKKPINVFKLEKSL